MAGCCNISGRLVLMLLALVFWFFAAGMIYLTVHIFDYIGPMKHMFDVYYLTGPAGVLIGLSILLTIVGFIGCLTSCKEKSRCLHITFFVMLLVIVMMEITGAVLAIVYKDEVNTAIETGMTQAINSYNDEDNVQESWDYMQETLHCCGVHNYTDWEKTPWGQVPEHKNQVPDSCCKELTENCGKDLSKDNIYHKGCYKMLYDDVKEYLAWIIATAILFALVQIFGLVCTCVRLWGKKKGGSSPYEVLGEDAKPEPISRGYPA
ncbi:tetraspanin-3-like [Amphiura filiformis]|uniref:tetraspanin-3-like n=1 Tax=Amphiura filiformis TaxID=82378 RepID=UPI003B20D3FA